MGVCGIDTNKNERKHNEKYTLNTIEGIKMLLEDVPMLETRRYYEGDFDASVILIDLHRAIDKAVKTKRLTKRQIDCMKLVYIEGYTNEEAAAKIGISDTTTYQHAEKGCRKLAEVFASWNYNEVC